VAGRHTAATRRRRAPSGDPVLSSRDHVLGNIRTRLGRGAEDPAHADARLREHPAGPLPARAVGAPDELRARFVEMARAASGEVEMLADVGELAPLVARLCAGHGVAAHATVSPDTRLDAPDWAAAGLEVERRAGRPEDRVCVSHALCGVAETGTLVLASGPDSPVTLNFLPELHVVALGAGQVLGSYEEAWQVVRAHGALPRTVNWITGPSRSADIEQTLQLGAHGPVRLVIALI